MSEWISVEDRLPPAGKSVMVLVGGVVCMGSRSPASSWSIMSITTPFSPYEDVSHWMEPPQ